jgi:UPF0716 protein FxsA
VFFIPLPIVILEVLIFTTWVHFYDFWDVVLAYIVPSFIGTVLFSMTGRSMMMAMQTGFQQGQLPGDRVLHRMAILVGSILLIIPMFLTRVLALLLIIPGFRHLSIFIFKTYIFQRLAKSSFSFVRFGGSGGGFQARGFQRGGFETHSEGPFEERDAEVVNVTPLEITHTKIVDDEKKKDDGSSSSEN